MGVLDLNSAPSTKLRREAWPAPFASHGAHHGEHRLAPRRLPKGQREAKGLSGVIRPRAHPSLSGPGARQAAARGKGQWRDPAALLVDLHSSP